MSMIQPEASIRIYVQTDVCSQAMLISNPFQKRTDAVERRMVIEDVVE